jgi:Tfp pilus assembly protein PilN
MMYYMKWGKYEMMKQSINLYYLLPQYLIVRLPAMRMMQLCGLILVMLMGIWGYDYWSLQSLHGDLRKAKTHQTTLIQQVAELKQKYMNDPEIVHLSQQVLVLQHEQQIKEYILNTLQQRASQGFSVYLDALAEQIVPNVWLTQIEMNKTGEIIIMGRAFTLELITQFIENLKNDARFAKKEFDLSKVEQGSIGEENPKQSIPQSLSFMLTMKEGSSS